jgi:inhibitor of KinA
MGLHPLGDQGVLAYCDDENMALQFAQRARGAGFHWLVDIVQAYTSVAVYYDLAVIDFPQVADQLRGIDQSASAGESAARLFMIPCCYELGLDWSRVENHTRLARDEVIRLLVAHVFTVYAIGFCPGFPYMGYLPGRLAGVPRLPAPRLRVAAGSIGLTGRQIGIYTEERPGGWNIVGRTPLELVDVRDEYFLLRTGDRVQFEPIDEACFQRLSGKRLTPTR